MSAGKIYVSPEEYRKLGSPKSYGTYGQNQGRGHSRLQSHGGSGSNVLAIIIGGSAALIVIFAAAQSTGGFGYRGDFGAQAVNSGIVPLPAPGHSGIPPAGWSLSPSAHGAGYGQ